MGCKICGRNACASWMHSEAAQLDASERLDGIDTVAEDTAAALKEQIDALATVLLQEFGGPTCDESACEMAVRLLRDQATERDEAVDLLRDYDSSDRGLRQVVAWNRKRSTFIAKIDRRDTNTTEAS